MDKLAKTKFETEWKKTQIDSKISTVENLMDVEVLERLQSEATGAQSKMDTDLLQDVASAIFDLSARVLATRS